MQKKSKSPSGKKRLKLRPWVLHCIDFIKILTSCLARLIVVIMIASLLEIPNVEKGNLDTNITSPTPVVEIVDSSSEIQLSHDELIEKLVQDVETGKAGDGEARKEYLGEYYEEVQGIINEKYKNISNTTISVATTGDKATYQAYAYELVIGYGWSEEDFNSLVILWERESNWNPNAHNKSSGAHGIPQSLPASKMASEGKDYMTNYKTQIRWGLKYIKNRYGNPTAALEHSNIKGWY